MTDLRSGNKWEGWRPPCAAQQPQAAYFAKFEAIPIEFQKMLECIGPGPEWSDVRFVARPCPGGYEFRSASVNAPQPQAEPVARLSRALWNHDLAEASGEATYKHTEAVIEAVRAMLAAANKGNNNG